MFKTNKKKELSSLIEQSENVLSIFTETISELDKINLEIEQKREQLEIELQRVANGIVSANTQMERNTNVMMKLQSFFN